ncbi:hypothetical protein N836_03980 [Leptolyngbya sp. Heron Island J]|nr:hypothetical protein [Leptolyngbya sp. Heron Island J]ESA37267.1 hypothetical protein N836_03980 [Leptolyngbya sp. Heron Island J]
MSPRLAHDAQSQQAEKIRKRLRKQQDHLFTSLNYPDIEATNNQAKR